MMAPTRANPRRGQNAHIQGCNGRSPRDQRAAKYPPKIWKGKSMRTATARSSLPRPFSTTLRLVAASCAAHPILATRCTRRVYWISSRKRSDAGRAEGTGGGLTLEFHDAPNRFVDTYDTRVLVPENFLSLIGALVRSIVWTGMTRMRTSFWKNMSQMVTQKQITLQKRR